MTFKSETLTTLKEGRTRIATRVEMPSRISLKTRRENSVNADKMAIFPCDEASPLVADMRRKAGGNSSAGLGTQL